MNAELNKSDFSTKLQVNADLATDWYEKGERLANCGNYAQALACFDKAVKMHPQNNAAWVFRGVVLIHLQRYEEAVASCNKALIIQPADNQAWLFRGAALNHLGRYKQSYDSYDKALGIQRQSLGQKLIQMFKGIFKLGNSSNTAFVIRNL